MISIVIPLFNKGPFIGRALDSINNQTFKAWECIVVDDGSTDNGPEIVESYSDSRIRLFRQNNMGVSVARNRGVELSTFPLVAFLDADDELLPNFLELHHAAHMEYKSIAVSFGNFRIVYESGESKTALPFTKVLETVFLKDYLSYILEYPYGMNSSSVCIRKDKMLEAGGFPPGRHWGEDIDTWCRLAWTGPVAYIPCLISVYYMMRIGAFKSLGANSYSSIYESWSKFNREGRIPKHLYHSSCRVVGMQELRDIYRRINENSAQKREARKIYFKRIKYIYAYSRRAAFELAIYFCLPIVIVRRVFCIKKNIHALWGKIK